MGRRLIDRANKALWRTVLASTLTFLAIFPPSAGAQAARSGCDDGSGHDISFVDVGNNVSIEVLDWGGTGRAVILLAGLGDTGHVFDDFALNFSPEFRVIAITRRGFGASAKPDAGYSAAVRSADVVRVMDDLDVATAYFVGHSIAGDELSYLGANFPSRVLGLVYLDAFDYGDGSLLRVVSQIPQDVREVDQPSQRDSLSLGHMAAHFSRVRSITLPVTEMCALWNVDENGRLISGTEDPQASGRILHGTHEADFESITAPALGIFASGGEGLVREGARASLSPESRRILPTIERALQSWRAEQIVRFESRLPNGRVEVIDGAHHYVFVSDAGTTVELMLAFFGSTE